MLFSIGLTLLVSLVCAAWATNLIRNRPFTREVPCFRGSRWTSGNRVWPTQVAVFLDRVVRYTPRLIGHFEETISADQVASVSVNAGLLFGDVIIETSGGSQPIRCRGHWKKDADEIRRRISDAQLQRRPSAIPA